MQQVTLSKRECRNWVAGLIAVPVSLFSIGLAVGLNINSDPVAVDPTVIATAPMALPVRIAAVPSSQSNDSLVANNAELISETAPVEVELSALESAEASIETVIGIPEQLSKPDEIKSLEKSVTVTGPEEATSIIADSQINVEDNFNSETLASKLMMPSEIEAVDVQPVLVQAYSFQVGSFSNRENANGFRQVLSKKGYPVNELYTDTQPPSVTSYKVRIGQYSTREEAAAAAQQYHQEEGGPVFIISPLQLQQLASAPSI